MRDARPAEPEYGPRGYLPERAARRARKIVLREQLGVGWPLASVLAGVVLLAAGVWFVLARTGPPAAPFEAVAAVEAIEPGAAAVASTPAGDVLVVRAGGGVRVFAAPPVEVVLCRESGRIEGADSTVWDTGGRRLGGPGGSLAPLPAEVHGGVVYADASAPHPAPEPVAAGVEPRCAVP